MYMCYLDPDGRFVIRKRQASDVDREMERLRVLNDTVEPLN